MFLEVGSGSVTKSHLSSALLPLPWINVGDGSQLPAALRHVETHDQGQMQMLGLYPDSAAVNYLTLSLL